MRKVIFQTGSGDRVGYRVPAYPERAYTLMHTLERCRGEYASVEFLASLRGESCAEIERTLRSYKQHGVEFEYQGNLFRLKQAESATRWRGSGNAECLMCVTIGFLLILGGAMLDRGPWGKPVFWAGVWLFICSCLWYVYRIAVAPRR